MKTRSFIATPIPRDVQTEIGKLLAELKQFPGVKWVEPEKIHITFKFMGNIEEGLFPPDFRFGTP